MDYFDSRDFLTSEPLPSGESDISQFFDGTNIFITGGTGFIGSLIIEKLLRCCPGIKRVFILLRKKKGKTEEERFHDLFKNDLFYKLWKTYPEFGGKIKLISGDCSQPQLGLSVKDRETLMDVNVIFHVAATLRFDEHLRQSFCTNVCATRDLLELAKQMKNIKGFTYISTAYSQVTEKTLKEVFYKSIFSYKEIKTIVDTCSDEEITQLMPLLLGRATTYSFTKSIAESVVESYKDDFPVGIVRPSIVISTYCDPLSGWLSSLTGQAAITLAVALGAMHVFNFSGKNTVDVVPGDKVASAVIACTWDYITNKPSNSIYNVCNQKRKLSWIEFENQQYHSRIDRNLASKYCVWEPATCFQTHTVLYKILVIMFHVLPGFFADIVLQITNKKFSVLSLYRRAEYLLHVMTVYLSKNWDFKDDNLYRVWNNMKNNDKKIFDFSMIHFNWNEYFCNYMYGLKVYILKESQDCESLIKARRKRDTFTVAHNVVTLTFGILLLSVFLYFLRR